MGVLPADEEVERRGVGQAEQLGARERAQDVRFLGSVATPSGLVVPVIRDADKKDLGSIAREIERLSAEARAGRPRIEDLKGGTYTVTSVGNIGWLISTPVINHPEVGILGIGKIVKRPVYDERGQIRPADLIYFSFSFDHRVVDGAIGAAFGNAVLSRLHAPATLLVD